MQCTIVQPVKSSLVERNISTKPKKASLLTLIDISNWKFSNNLGIRSESSQFGQIANIIDMRIQKYKYHLYFLVVIFYKRIIILYDFYNSEHLKWNCLVNWSLLKLRCYADPYLKFNGWFYFNWSNLPDFLHSFALIRKKSPCR